MKSLRLALLATLLLSIPSFAGAVWSTDYQASLALAAKENKKVLLDFTGSDWCGWCMRLQKETFSQPEFEQYAAKNLILVEVDFPNRKPQSEEVKRQNADLQAKFSVQGFPTLVLLDPQGKLIKESSGYLKGGPKAFIDWVEKGK